MTEQDILVAILGREGAEVKNDPHDPQDPSKFGIGAETLGNWLGLKRRATLDEVRQVTPPLALQIYAAWYVEQPQFTPTMIPYEPLRIQLIDFGVNSGPATAIKWLQRELKLVYPQITVDGQLGPQMQTLLHQSLGWLPIVNDALVGCRSYLVDRLTDQRAGYKTYEEGLENRALDFLLARS